MASDGRTLSGRPSRKETKAIRREERRVHGARLPSPLCTVHLLRNAQRHLSPENYAAFKQSWRKILAAGSSDSAQARFRALLEQLRPNNQSFAEHLQERSASYLAFLKYPSALHRELRSANLPEGLNNQIENLRGNGEGRFHSQREAPVKMTLLNDRLYWQKWTRVNPCFLMHLETPRRGQRQHARSRTAPGGPGAGTRSSDPLTPAAGRSRTENGTDRILNSNGHKDRTPQGLRSHWRIAVSGRARGSGGSAGLSKPASERRAKIGRTNERYAGSPKERRKPRRRASQLF